MQTKNSRSPLSRLLALFNISAGLRWWGQGLLLWLPASLRQRLVPTPVRLVVEMDADELIISEEKGRQRRELNRHTLAELNAGTLRLPRPQQRQVVLRLDPRDTLSKVTSMPLAAENNLQQVVGFEIDRLTPFTPEKLYYDAYVIERQPSERLLKVRFTAIMRATLDKLLEQLREAGAAPAVVDVADVDQGVGGGRLNLLPRALRPRRGKAAQGARWLLILLVLVTALAAAVLPIWQQRERVIELNPQVAEAKQRAEVTVARRTQLESALESSQFLLEKRADNIAVIDLLNELTVLLPDNTWVEQLIIKNNEVQIRGQSRDATALIGLVEASTYFNQATFRSPVTPDRRTGADRFFLTAQIAATAGASEPESDPRVTAADPS